jgi:hypothetical protein
VAHALEVERFAHPPDERFVKGGSTPGDLIQVAARDDIMPRVEAVRHHGRRQDVDVSRELVVQLADQQFRGERGADVEVRDLCQRVHPGVGAARAVELEVVPPGHGADRAIDFALHAPGVLLNLPAAVPRAGILDGELEAGHALIVGSRLVNPTSLSTITGAAANSPVVVSLVPSLLPRIPTLLLSTRTATG